VAHVLETIRLAADEQAFAVIAYCFMPDHLHLLVTGEHVTSDLRAFVDRVKQQSAYWYQRRTGGRLWQRSYWDRVLRNEEATFAAIHYIFANPVRAGLVSHPLDYPFSGSCVYTRDALAMAWVVGTPSREPWNRRPAG
jgi:putative transposase